MGNAESGEDYDDEFQKFEGIDTLGYRVLGVQPNSPASQAGLVSFFDFLVGANGKILLASGEDLEEGEEYDDVDFPALCQEFVNKPLELLVFNIKNQEKRLVTITPSDSWGGAGLLGVTIRLDDYGGADERLIRVLEVEKNSPAAICGLVEEHDYLLGTTVDSFDSTATLATVLHQHADRVVEVYVYNTQSDVVRVVALMPTYSWGGHGLLGAEVGTGYLHRLPSSSRETTGSSVERKVRWVGMKPAHPSSKADNLEVEPQLEMEVVEPHEETHKTVQQVAADHSTSNVPTVNRSSGAVSANRAIEHTSGASAPVKTEQDEGEKERRNILPTVKPDSEAMPPEAETQVPSEPTKAAPVQEEEAAAPVEYEETPKPPAEKEKTAQPAQQEPSAPAEPPAKEESMAAQQEVPAKEEAVSDDTRVPPSQQESAQSAKEDETSPQDAKPGQDAASFFAAGPPSTYTATAASYASQFLPPPPMSHLKSGEVDLH